MFDYFVYRVYRAYEKKHKGVVNSIFLASLFLFIFQFLILLSIYNFILIFTDGYVSIKNISSKALKIGFVIVAILFAFFYYRHYQKKIHKIEEKYKHHPANRWVKIWMFVVLALFLVFSPILWSFLHKMIQLSFYY